MRARLTPVRSKRTRPTRFARTSSTARRAATAAQDHRVRQQGITPKIDLSHVSKPGDVMKAILAKKQEEEAEARRSHVPPQQGCHARAEGSSKACTAGCLGRSAAGSSRASGAAQDRAAAAPGSCDCSSGRSRNCVEAAGWTGGGQGTRRRSRRPPCRHSRSA